VTSPPRKSWELILRSTPARIAVAETTEFDEGVFACVSAEPAGSADKPADAAEPGFRQPVCSRLTSAARHNIDAPTPIRRIGHSSPERQTDYSERPKKEQETDNNPKDPGSLPATAACHNPDHAENNENHWPEGEDPAYVEIPHIAKEKDQTDCRKNQTGGQMLSWTMKAGPSSLPSPFPLFPFPFPTILVHMIPHFQCSYRFEPARLRFGEWW
jgi:hypothetical protein